MARESEQANALFRGGPRVKELIVMVRISEGETDCDVMGFE